jgi:hypothetical protein
MYKVQGTLTTSSFWNPCLHLHARAQHPAGENEQNYTGPGVKFPEMNCRPAKWGGMFYTSFFFFSFYFCGTGV